MTCMEKLNLRIIRQKKRQPINYYSLRKNLELICWLLISFKYLNNIQWKIWINIQL